MFRWKNKWSDRSYFLHMACTSNESIARSSAKHSCKCDLCSSHCSQSVCNQDWLRNSLLPKLSMENSCISRTVSAMDFRLGSAYCLRLYSCLIFIPCVRCTIPSYRTARSLYSHPNIDDFRHQLQEPIVPTQRKDTNIGMQTGWNWALLGCHAPTI